MAEASPSTSAPQPSSSSFSVFMDTSLDTHLVMLVSPHDTVADLKGKVQAEHLLCFPDRGEISVQAIKVRHRAFIYHLSDSLPVKSAFVGKKGIWCLHIDLTPTTSILEDQTESARMPIEKGLKRTPIMHESQASPVTSPQKGTTQVDSSLPNISNFQFQNLHFSSTGPLVSGGKAVDTSARLNVTQPDLNDSRSEPLQNHGVPEMENLVADADVLSGPNPCQISGVVADEGNKDGKGGVHENVGVEADNNGVPVVPLKKDNSRKRSRTLHNDVMLDDKSQEFSAKKRERKKEKDGYYTGPVENQPKGENTCLQKNDLNEKHYQDKCENSMPPLKEFSNQPSHVDLLLPKTPTYGKKKKKREKQSKLHDENTVDVSLKKIISSLEKQGAEENRVEELVQNRADLDGSSREFVKKQFKGGVQDKKIYPPEKDLNEKNFQEKHENNLSSEGFPDQSCHVHSFVQETFIHDIKKKRKKNRSKLHDRVPQHKQVDNLLKKSDITVGNVVAEENHVAELVQNQTDFVREVDIAETNENNSQKAANNAEVGTIRKDSLSANFKVSNYDDETLAKSRTTNSELPVQEVSSINEGPPHAHPTALSRESNAAIHEQPIEEIVKVLEGSRHRRYKSKRQKDTSSKPDTLVSLVKFMDEDNDDESSVKLSEVAGVATVAEDRGNEDDKMVDSGFHSNNFAKASHQTRKKKRQKSKLSNAQSNTHVTDNSSKDKVAGENQKEKSSIHQKLPGNNIEEGAAIPANSAAIRSIAVESTAPFISSDSQPKRNWENSEKADAGLHSGRNEAINLVFDQIIEEALKQIFVHHWEHQGIESEEAAFIGEARSIDFSASKSLVHSSEKIFKKMEPPHQDSMRDESVRSMMEKAAIENPKESASHLGHPGENPEGAAEFGEAAVVANPQIPEATVPIRSSKRKSKHSRKRPRKGELPGQEPGIESIDNPVKEAANEKAGAAVEEKVDSSDKHETRCLGEEKAAEKNALVLDKSLEESAKETLHYRSDEVSQDLNIVKNHVGLFKSNTDRIDLLEFSDLKGNQLDPVQDHPSVVESDKMHTEKTEKKKKLTASPQGSIANLILPVSDKHHIPKNDAGMQKNCAVADFFVEDADGLAGPVHITEEDTPVQIKSRVAVRKVPSNRYKKILRNAE